MEDLHELRKRLAATENTLRETERFLADLIENSGALMVIKNIDGAYRFVNRKWEEVSGLRREEVLGKTDAYLFPPEAAEQFRRNDAEVLRSGEFIEFEEQFDRPDGRHYYLAGKFPVRGEDGAVTGLCGIITDITDRKRAEERLRISNERLELAMAATNDGLWDWNLLTGKVYFDPRYYTMAGYEPDEFPASFDEWTKRLHPDDLPLCEEALRAHFTQTNYAFDMKFRFLRKDGTWMWIRGRGKCVERDAFGNAVRMVGTHIDITELKRQGQEIEFLSFHDHLTGLYNRRFFDEEFLRLDTTRNLPLTLLLMDVNGLKLTNDAFGHQAGDSLLKTVADVLRRTCRGDEIIARIGGDEFAILLPRTDEEGVSALCARIADGLARENAPAGPLSLAFGLATKRGEESVGEIFTTAENRMYQHKICTQEFVRSQAITFIMRSLSEKCPREREHSERVGELAGKIGAAMEMNAQEIELLLTAATFHDIGKIAVAGEILDKNGPLKESEWLAVRRHSEIGYSILNSGVGFAAQARVVLAHQERFDGKGYPKGLAGRDIPLHARIISVADAYDAITSGRPYRPARSPGEALREIEAASGTQFDPEIVEAFLSLFPAGTEAAVR